MFIIDPYSKIPISSQLKIQIIKYIGIGLFDVNQKFPSVHSLSNEFGINPYIVLRAYQKLESEGFIHSIDKEWYVNQIIFDQCIKENKVSSFKRLVSEFHDMNMEKILLLSATERIYKGGTKYAED